jgi:HEAT repeat protein
MVDLTGGSMLSLMLLLGCTPTYVEHDDITRAVAQKDLDALCVGLSMPDPTLRTYATEQLRTFKEDKVAECICEKLPSKEEGWDRAIAEGMKGENRNAVSKCFAELVKQPGLPGREEAILMLGEMSAPYALAALDNVAMDPKNDAKIRAQALKMVGGMQESVPTAMDAAKSKDAVLRVAAMEALALHPKDKEARKFIKENIKDEDGSVRAAAMLALKRHIGIRTDDMLCKAMLDDPDPQVRVAAIMGFKDLSRRDPIRCLRKKSTVLEEDPMVRDALLDVLKTMKGDARESGHKILCDAIPFWLRTYIKDDVVGNLKGVGIVKAQNDADWENSLKCFENAYRRSSGYSCYAKMHIGLWYFQVAGRDGKIPLCPGIEEYSE